MADPRQLLTPPGTGVGGVSLPGPDLSPLEKLGLLLPALSGNPAIGLASLLHGTVQSSRETDPQSQAFAQQYGRVDEGMIPTLENLDKFNAIRKAIAQALPEDLPQQAKNALSYMAVRYPKRMQSARAIIGENMGPGFGGSYQASTSGQKGTVYYNPNQKSMSDIVGSLAHETQHSVDVNRKGVDFLAEGIPNMLGLKFLPKLDRNRLPIEQYKALPSEANAYQAGDTAKASFAKYLDLLAQHVANRFTAGAGQ